jgi:hypothetical protein
MTEKTMTNMFVTSNDDLCSIPIWFILAMGLDNNIAFIDIAFTKAEAYAKIERIKTKMMQSGEENYRRYMEDVMDGVIPRTINDISGVNRSREEH